MDPLVKAMSAVARALAKIVGSVESDQDRLILIAFAERKLAELKK